MDGRRIAGMRRTAAVRAGAWIAAAALVGSLAAGCLSADETPKGETEAAGKAVQNARAVSDVAGQQAKDANDMTAVGH